MKKLLGYIVVILTLSSCISGTELPPYDAEAQLLVDIENIEAYLNSRNKTATVDPTGIHYIIVRDGNGDIPKNGEIVTVNYRLYNFEDRLLDTNIEQAARDGGIYSENRTYEPFQVFLGLGQVIPGFEASIKLLSLGGEGEFYIPSVLAYQNRANGNIEANESLLFIIELLTIEEP